MKINTIILGSPWVCCLTLALAPIACGAKDGGEGESEAEAEAESESESEAEAEAESESESEGEGDACEGCVKESCPAETKACEAQTECEKEDGVGGDPCAVVLACVDEAKTDKAFEACLASVCDSASLLFSDVMNCAATNCYDECFATDKKEDDNKDK